MNKKLTFPACEYLPSNIIDEMKNHSINSSKDGLERGFTICSSAEYWSQMDNKNTITSGRCIGTECKITTTKEEVKKSCFPDKKDLGFFHTHPTRELSYPSFDDIVSMHALEHKFACIGSKSEIKCFSQDVPAPKSFMDIPSKEYERFKKQWKEYVDDCKIVID